MIKSLILPLLIILFIFTPYLVAANGVREQVVDISMAENMYDNIAFKDALKHALDTSPKIYKSQVAVEIAKQGWRRARSALLPRLDLSSTTQKINQYGDVPGLESLILGGRSELYQTTSDLRLGVNIYNGGSDLASLNLASEKIKEAELQLQLQRVTIAITVLDHVHEVRQAELDFQGAQLQYNLSQKKLKQAHTSLSLGRISALSYAEIQYDFKNKEREVKLKNRAYRQSFQKLIKLIGDDSNLISGSESPTIPEDYADDLRLYDFRSLRWFSEINISESRIRQAEMEIKRARSSYLPKVDLFTSISYSAVSETDYGQAFNNQDKDNRLIGLTFSWNLFNGLNSAAEVKEAVQRSIDARNDLHITQVTLNNETSDLDWQLRDSEEELAIETQYLDLLEMKLNINREKLELGRIDDFAFNSIKMEWQLQQQELVKLTEKVNYYQARLFLQQRME